MIARSGRLGTTGLDDVPDFIQNQIVIEPFGYRMTPASRLDAAFSALADPTRRAILARLALGEASVLELAEPFSMSQPAISKHLKVLEQAGLISRGRDAQRRPCRIEGKAFADVEEWLENYRRFWEGQFRQLDALLVELKAAKKKSKSGNARHPKKA